MRRILFNRPVAFWESDPHFSSVVFLCHFNGTNGSTNFTDIKGNTIAARGTARIDDSTLLLNGGALLADGGYLEAAYNPSYNLDSNDFTIDFFIRFISLAAGAVINRYGGAGNSSFVLQSYGSGLDFYVYLGGSYASIRNVSLSTDTTYYIGIKRESNTISLWVNGVQRGTDSFSGPINSSTIPLFIGAESGGVYAGRFRMDELRFTVGVARDLSIIPS